MPNPMEYHPTLDTMLNESSLLVTPEPLRRLQEASIKNGCAWLQPHLSLYDYLCGRQHIFGLISPQIPGDDPEDEEEYENRQKEQEIDWTADDWSKPAGRNSRYWEQMKMHRSKRRPSPFKPQRPRKKQNRQKWTREKHLQVHRLNPPCTEKITSQPVDAKFYLKDGASLGKTFKVVTYQMDYFDLDIGAVADKMVQEFQEINLMGYCREDGSSIIEKKRQRMILPKMSLEGFHSRVQHDSPSDQEFPSRYKGENGLERD